MNSTFKLKIYLSLSMVLMTLFSIRAQQIKYIEDLSRIMVKYKDSTIEISTFTKNIPLKLHDNVQYYWYSSNLINKNYGGYSGKLLHGEYLVFTKNKNLLTKGYFKKGTKNGKWKSWYMNGNLKISSNWKKGKLQGAYKKYYQNGNIEISSFYKNGLKNGEYIRYGSDTTIVKHYKLGHEIDIYEKEAVIKRLIKKLKTKRSNKEVIMKESEDDADMNLPLNIDEETEEVIDQENKDKNDN